MIIIIKKLKNNLLYSMNKANNKTKLQLIIAKNLKSKLDVRRGEERKKK